MAIDLITRLVNEVDRLDTEINALLVAMMAKLQDKNTTIVDVQIMAMEWSSKGQARVLKYQELQGLLATRSGQNNN